MISNRRKAAQVGMHHMKISRKSTYRVGLQIALMGIAFALSSAMQQHAAAIGLIWLAAAIGLGLCWEWLDKKERRHAPAPRIRRKRSALDISHVFIVLSISILVPAMAAVTDFEAASTTGVALSFIGIPILLPLGPIALGRICSLGYSLSIKLLNPRLIPRRAWIIFTLTLLGFVADYGVFYSSSDFHSVGEFLQSFSMTGPAWLLGGLSYRDGELVGVAPWPQITAIVQVVGYCVGGGIAILQETGRDQSILPETDSA